MAYGSSTVKKKTTSPNDVFVHCFSDISVKDKVHLKHLGGSSCLLDLLDLRFHSCMEGPFMHPNGAMESKPLGSGVYAVYCITSFIFYFIIIILFYFPSFFLFYSFCSFAVSHPHIGCWTSQFTSIPNQIEYVYIYSGKPEWGRVTWKIHKQL